MEGASYRWFEIDKHLKAEQAKSDFFWAPGRILTYHQGIYPAGMSAGTTAIAKDSSAAGRIGRSGGLKSARQQRVVLSRCTLGARRLLRRSWLKAGEFRWIIVVKPMALRSLIRSRASAPHSHITVSGNLLSIAGRGRGTHRQKEPR